MQYFMEHKFALVLFSVCQSTLSIKPYFYGIIVKICTNLKATATLLLYVVFCFNKGKCIMAPGVGSANVKVKDCIVQLCRVIKHGHTGISLNPDFFRRARLNCPEVVS